MSDRIDVAWVKANAVLRDARATFEAATRAALPGGRTVYYNHGQQEREGEVLYLDTFATRAKLRTPHGREVWVGVKRIMEVIAQ